MMSEEKRIRLLIVDDHAMVRVGLAAFVRPYADLVVVGEASTGEEALRRCDQDQPDVVLMDLVMPGMDGVTTTQKIRQAHPLIQVIALTSFGKEELVKAALQAGAIGYLFKDVSSEDLVQAIRAAAAGQRTLAKEALETLISAVTQPTAEAGNTLTEKERKVLLLMSQGLSNNEIAKQLGVSPSTIKTHVSNILFKLGVDSRVEAVTFALQHHLAG
ncbi:MAG TPA: response regulator transcription factor [Aggregatilineaceae bacterium]|nr:response regulator transcription factor [Aggregatilineaceae bacterium]